MFKETLILWMAGFGMTEEQCAKVCENPRMVANIQRKDGGAVIQDLPRILYLMDAHEAYNSLNSTQEKLMLMMMLK